ncbi:MAG: hypothetical protein HOC20_07705 [Chloroflexi bacterium]|jgi:hypothetical protein|nr:hypothetical protein [Chloroflexota bacterium]
MIKFHRKSRWAMAVTVLLLIAVVVPITAVAAGGHDEDHSITDAEYFASMWGIDVDEAIQAMSNPANGDDALMRDAKCYAKDWGISIDEALKQLELQDTIGELGAKLTEQESDTFGGLWIQHIPEYRIVVQFTDNGEKTLQPYIENGPLIDSVEVRTVDTSLKDLKAIQRATITAVQDMRIPFESALVVSKNTIELYAIEKDAQVLAANKNILPGKVDIISVDELSKPGSYIFGGLTLDKYSSGTAYCTAGFSCKNSSGTKGILTAGHARNTLYYNGTYLPMVSEQFECLVDAQWHTTPGYTPTNWIYDGYSTRSITATKNHAYQSEGEYVSKYGRVTGFTWGYITTTHFLPSYISCSWNSAFYVYVHRSGVNLVDGGDSGGPWFSGNTAYGITSGEKGNDGVYMAVDPYVQSIGVTVMTSP